MILKPTHLLMATVFATAVIALSPAVNARNAYRLQAQTQYKLVGADGKGGIGCIYCHTSSYGGSNRNAFGTALDVLYDGAAKRNISQALYLILKANKDSDKDGYSDLLEVVAKTAPGDATSKPTKTTVALTADLKKLGGVDAFKPKP
jgi:hypothetical protein